ncbi:hypothetical protein M3O96_07485 [Aquiflexum sp. TKW24L]|uniref:hypothetical protein n=1 Tax=Aquiflexum sp. TKW24L TaxID=2942212 RepID=UPI0020BF4F54|nr:hypothetical protein [Aquiflexum sp. TKW24L]MCL6258921.1 hypothetical protein [Aquiflexum sp. TKW24L]
MILYISTIFGSEFQKMFGGKIEPWTGHKIDYFILGLRIGEQQFNDYCEKGIYHEGIKWEKTIRSLRIQLSQKALKNLIIQKPELSNELLLNFISNEEKCSLKRIEFLKLYIEFIDLERIFKSDEITIDLIFLKELKKQLKIYNREADLSYLKIIGQNKNVIWSVEFLKESREFLSWDVLSSSKYLNFSKGLIEEFKNYWSWDLLSENENIQFNEEFLDKFKGYWNWNKLSSNKSVPLTIELLKKFKKYWDWSGLSGNGLIFWSKEYFFEFKDSIDFFRMAGNKNVDWTHVFNNYKYSIDPIKEKDFCLQLVFNNPAFNPKAQDLIYFKENLYFRGNHPDPRGYVNLKSTKLLKYSEKLNNSYRIHNNDLLYEEFSNAINFRISPCLSSNIGLKWTDDLLSRFFSKLDFWLIALRGNLDLELIEKFSSFFEEIRFTHVTYGQKKSDFGTPSYYHFHSGWQNLSCNPNFTQNEEFLVWASKRTTRIIPSIEYFYGDNFDIERTITNINIEGGFQWVTLNEVFTKRINNFEFNIDYTSLHTK